MSRSRRWAGLALLCVGLLIVGWCAWQFVGTNWTSHRAQRQVIEQLEDAWATQDTEAQTDRGTARALVRIPRFGKDYRVPILEGTDEEALASGFGHLEGTAEAGEVGNYVLSGHRVTHGEPLRNMPDLTAGDLVIVETASRILTYELTNDGDALDLPFTATWVTAPTPRNPDPGGVSAPDAEQILTLTTCASLFHTDRRLVAFARLIAEEPRPTRG